MPFTFQQLQTAGCSENRGRRNENGKTIEILEEVWESYRAIIERLYLNQSTAFPDFMRIMEKEHGFEASEQQYRAQFLKWGIRKETEKRAISIERDQPGEKRARTAFNPTNRGNLEASTSTRTTYVPNRGTTQRIDPSMHASRLNGTPNASSPITNPQLSNSPGPVNGPGNPTGSFSSSDTSNFTQPQIPQQFHSHSMICSSAGYRSETLAGLNGVKGAQPSGGTVYPLPQIPMQSRDSGYNKTICQNSHSLQTTSPTNHRSGTVTSLNGVQVAQPSSGTMYPQSQVPMQSCESGYNKTICQNSHSLQTTSPTNHRSGTVTSLNGVQVAQPSSGTMYPQSQVPMQSCESGYNQTIGQIIPKQANIMAASERTSSQPMFRISNQPIHQAVFIDSLDAVLFLVEADPKCVHVLSSDGVSAIWIAAQHGYLSIARLLIEHHVDLDTATAGFGHAPIHRAALNGHLRIVELLLDNGAKADPRSLCSVTPLYLAAQQGHYEIVRVLLKMGADKEAICHNGTRPIHIAAANSHLATVQILLEQGANANPDNKTPSPLYLSAQNGNVGISKLLIERGADVGFSISPSRKRPLHRAAENGHTEIVRLLIQHRAELDAVEEGGLTAMMFASAEGHTGVVDLLIKGGANVNIEREDGLTSLWVASYQGHTSVVKMLLAANAKPLATKLGKRRPIHQAAQNGHFEVLKQLVEHNPEEVNAEDKDGLTPLYLALRENKPCRLSMMKYLVSTGAKVTV